MWTEHRHQASIYFSLIRSSKSMNYWQPLPILTVHLCSHPAFKMKSDPKSKADWRIKRALILIFAFSPRIAQPILNLSLLLFCFQYQLRSIGILGIAIVTILHLRLSIPGPVTHFSTADNPTAKANAILTRLYTFAYLPVFNFKLLAYPHTLSFDWGMDAIPRITSLCDGRNVLSLAFYAALCRVVIKCVFALRTTLAPKPISTKRLSRTINKRKHPKTAVDDDDNNCSVCKQGLKQLRHASSVGFGAALAPSGANGNKKQVISLSPLKKYIRNNNNNNNCNDNNNFADVELDSNNNNVCAVDNNCNQPAPATVLSAYRLASKHLSQVNRKASVKSLSSALASLVGHVRCAEQSSKQTKLSGASAALVSIAILTLPFLPASNLFFYVGFVVAERILYLPSIGYCLLIGLGLGKLINFKVQCSSVGGKARPRADGPRHHSGRSMAAILLLIVVIGACSLKTIRRNRDWRDEESLYRSAIKVNPPKGKLFVLPFAIACRRSLPRSF